MDYFKKYINTDDIFKNKSKKIYYNLLSMYKNGTIKNETEFLYKLKLELVQLYEEIKFKTFKYRPAYYTPISEDYNLMISEALNDINNSIEYANNYSEIIENDIINTDINNKYFYNSINNYIKIISDLYESVNSYSSSNLVNYINNFTITSNSKMVNKNLGILQLPYSSKTIEDDYTIEILESNGYPGNTHVINKSINNITFEGESNINANIENIKDNTSNSLEYELFKIDDEVYNACNCKGFDYKEGYSFISDDDELYLVLRITPQSNRKYNSLTLKPYLPSQNTYTGSIIEKVLVYSSNSSLEIYELNNVFDNTTTINFSEQSIKYIEIYLKQEIPYNVNIGHFYTIKNTNIDESYFNSIEDKVFNRVNRYLPSITSLGLSYDANEETILHPSTSNDYNFSQNQAIDDLFTIPTSYENEKSGIEVIKAKRYMIGINQIILSKFEYSNSGTYISQTYTTDNNISKLSLYTDDAINLNEDEGYLKYYISFGDDTWYNINPKQRSYLGLCEIRINSPEPKANRNTDKIYYIDKLLDTKSFILKIEMHKEENARKYVTPVVYNYRIEVETEANFFEYM